MVTAKVNPSIPRCPACNEPRAAHPGTQWSEWLFNPQDSEHDVLKSSTWGSSEKHWNRWIFRPLYISNRLLDLLKKIKAVGFNPTGVNRIGGGAPTFVPRSSLNQEEAAWIQASLSILKEHGIAMYPAGTVSDEDSRWFREYLKSHATAVTACDFKAVEKRAKVKLPKSYVDFITKVGPSTFEDVDQQEGFTARVLSPENLDFAAYRKGALEMEDEESRTVDGVMFATTDHGDCFCFDVQKGKKEYPVFHFKHEYDHFEPYAENFAACIRRFAGE